MKQNLSEDEAMSFIFKDEYSNFSSNACRAIVEDLIETENETEEDYTFDMASIRGSYTEYPSFSDWALDYTGKRDLNDALDQLGLEEKDEIPEFIEKFEIGYIMEFIGGIIIMILWTQTKYFSPS